MIPFSSQRALGQDLAMHLLNEHDNEYMEVADVRGAVADDLHGAFAEWEAQAHALTKCENYLYSLSINPDPQQGQLSRDQYLDYIDQAEEKLGLSGQPRAVVFHIKHDREHCHVVWSRIDLENEKAIPMSFDRDKLMMVTRLFAKEHDLELPKGYFKGKEEERGQQLSLYEMHQQKTTGLSKAQHQEQVTDVWRASDSAKAFVHGLADRGYLLATGKRPYVLVDLYGGMHALPKMIADKTVRTKDIRKFLEKGYPPESLPTVDEARELVAQHRKAMETQFKAEQQADKLAMLKQMQARRREKREGEQVSLKQKQHQARLDLAQQHDVVKDFVTPS
ncbi:MAG: relaxase/mobilization nuclease domain-containing protein [Gammaproteobacteria bacterium (ex Lamellibrachia satsuma)]|nr:MAG: relaxase/mobilization nuclease domain-containing protein [Gammaproteobacteria bacterium (ex Lamellibrachia satsuma)]